MFAALAEFEADVVMRIEEGPVVHALIDMVRSHEGRWIVNDITPYIRATYSARINNDLVTDVGDSLQNSATAYFTNGDTGAQDSINDATAPITAMDTHY